MQDSSKAAHLAFFSVFCVLLVLVSVSVLFSPYMCLYDFCKVQEAEWPSNGKKTAHSVYLMFSLCIMLAWILPILLSRG